MALLNKIVQVPVCTMKNILPEFLSISYHYTASFINFRGKWEILNNLFILCGHILNHFSSSFSFLRTR